MTWTFESFGERTRVTIVIGASRRSTAARGLRVLVVRLLAFSWSSPFRAPISRRRGSWNFRTSSRSGVAPRRPSRWRTCEALAGPESRWGGPSISGHLWAVDVSQAAQSRRLARPEGGSGDGVHLRLPDSTVDMKTSMIFCVAPLRARRRIRYPARADDDKVPALAV